jgi:hypothetical protein
MKIFIHIGQPKTGTTSIQKFLKHNKLVLLEKGYYYQILDTGTINQSSADYSSHNHNAIMDKFWKEKDIEVLNSYFKHMLSDAKQEGTDSIIISSEVIWSRLYLDNIKKFCDIFRGHTIQIIVFIKRPDLYIESLWQQYFFAEYDSFNQYLQVMPIDDYYEKLKNWQNYSHKLTITPFEKRYFSNGLEKHFLQLIGINQFENFSFNHITEDDGSGSNKGLTPQAINLVMKNKNLIDKDKNRLRLHIFINRYLGSIFEKEHGETYSFLTYEQRLQILRKFQGMITNISNDFFEGSTDVFEKIESSKKSSDTITNDIIIKSLISIGVKQDEIINQLRERIERLEGKIDAKNK